MKVSEVERVEQLGQTRLMLLGVISVVLGAMALVALIHGTDDHGERAFGIPAGALTALVLISGAVIIGTGGALTKPAGIRAILNDEATREHRRTGIAWGFGAMLVVALAEYATSFGIGTAAPSLRTAIVVLVASGEATALARFVWAEAVAHGRG